MKKKTLLYVFNVLFIALIGVLTFNLLFKDQELGQILDDLDKANKLWLLGGAGHTVRRRGISDNQIYAGAVQG